MSVTYDDKPWLRQYDPGVPHEVAIPSTPLPAFLTSSAQKYPNQTAIIFKGRRITYRELDAQTDAVAAALAANGFKKGDRAVIYMANTPQFVISYYGVLKAGGIVIATNPLYTERELGVHLKKGYAVTDWEARPFQQKQLQYALNDVLFLPELRERLQRKLQGQQRTHWADEELALLERADYYYKDPNDEALKSNMMRSLKTREQVFLLRLFAWRRQVAEQRDHSKEMVLPAKYISHIVRGISSGREALKHSRRIPTRTAEKYGAIFEELYNRPVSDEEREILKRMPSESDEDPKERIIMEMLYQVIKYKCLEQDISINMVVPRGELKKIRADEDDALDVLAVGWRQEMLGAYFLDWLSNANRMKVDLLDDRIVIHPEEHS